MKLLIGLGNPGAQYQKVRHNLGFMVLDGMGKNWILKNKFKSEVMELDKSLMLVKPQTYMNNSGLAVRLLTTYYKIPSFDVIVVHDDLDLPLGKIKVRLGGAAAGHHGVESIIEALGTDKFIRIRLGIGNLRSLSGEHKKQHFNAEHYVLENFMPGEKSKVKTMKKQALKALEILIDQGLDKAQNQFN